MDNETQAIVNPLLDKLRIPGSTFRLPSQGLFYDEGVLHASVKNGEVEVYPMTAMDEIIMNTPDKLLSGKAILEVFSRCIPSILRPNDLLSKDVDFLMVCLRLVSFGTTMDLSYEHSCEHAEEHKYTVDIEQMVNNARQIDPTTINTEYVMPMQNGQVVTLKPFTYVNIVELYQTTALIKSENVTAEEAKKLIISTITNIIGSVDGVKDKTFIEQWVTKIPLGWKKQIERRAQDVTQWGVDFLVKQQCPDCGEEITLQVAANPVSFFT